MTLVEYNEYVDNFVEILTKPEKFLEYKIGSAGFATKYIQRFGSPGNYRYVYPSKKIAKLGRRARFHYARFLKRSKRFFSNLSISYDAQSFNVKPKTWKTAVVNVRRKNGDFVQLHVNLKKHGIYAYRSKRGQGGEALKLGRAKKKGILRYR